MATQTAIPISAPKHATQAVFRFAWGVFAFMVLVVLWGAVVRATSSGGGCGSRWPLCNGDFFPHHPRLATIIEFTHRSMSGICTFLVAALAAWTFYATGRGHRARRAVVWSAGLLVMEAFLGAVLVLRGYVESNISLGRVVMQALHFTNTLLLLGALALTAWFLNPRRNLQRASYPASQPARGLAILSVVATIVMGATGALAALADTLFPSPSLQAGLAADFAASAPLLVRMRWIHPAATVLGFVCIVLLAQRLRSHLSLVVVALMVMQAALGALDILLLAPTCMQVVHLLGADIYWAALAGLAADVLWPAGTVQPAA